MGGCFMKCAEERVKSIIVARVVVYHHNALTQEVYDRFVTPMESMCFPFAMIGI